METTIEKTEIKKLNLTPVKDYIKKEVEKQKFLKNAMKNATLTYDQNNAKPIWDPMPPSKAQSDAWLQGKLLRLMYAAYGLLRGKSFSQTENHYPEENHPLNMWKDNLIRKYLEQFQEMSKIKE